MKKARTSRKRKEKVIIIQDGALDELMSVVLAGTMSAYEVIGIGVVNADCLAAPTVEVTHKILGLMNMKNVALTISDARAVNAFPWIYRQYSMMANLLPMLNTKAYPGRPSKETCEKMLIRLIKKCMANGDGPVRLVVLSPLTPVATVLKSNPELIDGIRDILWMGGSVLSSANPSGAPQGNVDPGIAPGANPNAEWNAYWDPYAAKEILDLPIPMTMFPLNATNDVMLSAEIVLKFAPESEKYPLYALAGQMYSMVAFEAGYAFWDTVTTAYLDRPDLYTVRKQKLEITVDGPTQGNIYKSRSGNKINVVTDIDVKGFYKYIFKQFKYLR